MGDPAICAGRKGPRPLRRSCARVIDDRLGPPKKQLPVREDARGRGTFLDRTRYAGELLEVLCSRCPAGPAGLEAPSALRGSSSRHRAGQRRQGRIPERTARRKLQSRFGGAGATRSQYSEMERRSRHLTAPRR